MAYGKKDMSETSKPLGPPHHANEADYRVAIRRARERSLSLEEFLEDNDYELDAQGRPVRKQRI